MSRFTFPFPPIISCCSCQFCPSSPLCHLGGIKESLAKMWVEALPSPVSLINRKIQIHNFEIQKSNIQNQVLAAVHGVQQELPNLPLLSLPLLSLPLFSLSLPSLFLPSLFLPSLPLPSLFLLSLLLPSPFMLLPRHLLHIPFSLKPQLLYEND